ncbi:MAG: hypothetical protein AMS27_06345 [Bacteroides sp. SM23_62_1]|nr:MAG: hypothetical protein AMS27_06345 [Bacteroides sp. SM23_62_1]
MKNKITRRRFIASTAAATAAVSASAFNIIQNGSHDGTRICIFSKHLQFLDYHEMADTIAEIGFDGADLTVRPGGHILPENVEQDLPVALEALKSRGLAVPMITTALTDPDDPLTTRILKTAGELGIHYYRMGYFRYDEEKEIEETILDLRSNIAGLVELNKNFNLHGAYQNHAGDYLGAPVWDLWMLIGGFEPDYIGCQYDIRHATVEGGTSWPLGLKLLQPYIRTIVVKDFKWEKINEKWEIIDVPLGEGMVDWDLFFRFLKELGFSGPISIHVEYHLFDEKDTTLSKNHKKKITIENIRRDLTFLKTKLTETELI